MDQTVFQFGAFELNVSSYEVRRAGLPVKLERIPMDLLLLLVEKRGDLVSREAIIQRLWGDSVFLETEHSINTAVNKLRAVLQDHPRKPLFIQTVVGKGYRFIAEVKLMTPEATGPAAATASSAVPDPFFTAAMPSFKEVAPVPVEIGHCDPPAQPGTAGPFPRKYPLRGAANPVAANPGAAPVTRAATDLRATRTLVVATIALVAAAGLGYLVRGCQDNPPWAGVSAHRSSPMLPSFHLSQNRALPPLSYGR